MTGLIRTSRRSDYEPAGQGSRLFLHVSLLFGLGCLWQLRPPLGRLVGLAPGVVELDEAFQALGEAWLCGGRDLRFAVFQPGIAFEQERLGFWELLLSGQRAPSMLFGSTTAGLHSRAAFESHNLFRHLVNHALE